MKHRIHVILSVFVALCLALQVYAFRGRKLAYPFIDYPMYSQSVGPPVQAAVRTLYVQMPDGKRLKLDKDYFGVGWFAWRYGMIEPLIEPPLRVEEPRFLKATPQQARQAIIDMVQRREGVDPVAAVIDTHWHIVEQGRIVESDETLRVPLSEEVSP